MKFLKKDVTEGNSVQGIVERIAISNPDISFRFIREGRQAMITAGNGDLKSTIYSVYGSELSETLVPVEYHYSGMRLTGYVSRPHQSRKSRAMQFFFINGRLVDSRLAKAALEQAYKNLIMVGRFPACVLNIEMDTKLVDVNVHPAKIEVRFVNEKPIFDLIYYGVKTAVEQQDTVKEGKLSDNSISSVYGNQIKTNSSKIDFFKKEEKPNQLKFSSASPKTWSLASPKAQLRRETSEEENIKKDIKEESVFDKPIEAKEKAEIKTEQIEIPVQNNAFSENTQPVTEEIDSSVIVDEKDDAPVFRVVGEAFRTYIIVEIENDLYYIDKHAAHERMNFEKLKAESNISSQLLLMPVAVKLSAEEYSVITDNIPLLSKCGFEVEDFGNLSVIVRETPSMLDGSDIKDLILEIAEKLLRHKTDIEPDKMDWIFHSTACRSAVKGGDYTSEKERELFVEKLLSMPDIRYCPHGRPVMIKISRYELEKQFGRIQ